MTSKETRSSRVGYGHGGPQFVPLGDPVSNVLNLIVKNRYSEAAELFLELDEDACEEFIEGLHHRESRQLYGRAAKVLGLARDFDWASQCAEWAGDAGAAKEYQDKSADIARTGQFSLNLERLFTTSDEALKNRDFKTAGEIFYEMGDWRRSAKHFERDGAYLHAGRLHLKCGQPDQALKVLQLMLEPSEKLKFRGTGSESLFEERMADFLTGQWLLGWLYEQKRQQDPAMQCYELIVSKVPHSEHTAVVYDRLAAMYRAAGRENEAQRLCGDPPAAKKETPWVEEATQPIMAGPERLAAKEREFAVLRQAPVFSELSVPELRLVHDLAENMRFSEGERMMRRACPVDGMLLIVAGKVWVNRRNEAGFTLEMRELSVGRCVGHLSIVDNALNDTDVSAVNDVQVLRFDRKRLQHLIASNDGIALGFYKALVADLVRRLRAVTK